ncbi:MAG TPA: cytochrome c [Candidatus Sulfotelmatobacter sp.]|nr:cytochrome c [Candidatus Sulfotelmatobacter sp.]
MRPWLNLSLLLLFPLSCVAQSQNDSVGQSRSEPKPFQGAKIFQYDCAACHGADGRGHGPASVTLKHAAPDLTLISQTNGGKFPYRRVKRTIEGKTPAPVTSGVREMPIWGPIFHEVEFDQDWGEVRLEAVTKYVESIQKK